MTSAPLLWGQAPGFGRHYGVRTKPRKRVIGLEADADSRLASYAKW
jgi:hypothetical protein